MDVCRADAKGEQRLQQYNPPLNPPISGWWEKLRGNRLQKAHFGLKPNAGMRVWEGEEEGGGGEGLKHHFSNEPRRRGAG